MVYQDFGPRFGAAFAVGAIALFVVWFGSGAGLESVVLRAGAAAGGALAGAVSAPLFGRQGGQGWLLALGAALAATFLGGAVAGVVFEPSLHLRAMFLGAVMGHAMVWMHPLPALVWLLGFAALHLALRRGRGLQVAGAAGRVGA